MNSIPNLSLRTKLFYGAGQTAEGVKGALFETFLFFYYTQVLGLSGTLCGLALMITVCTDAVTDPIMGSISDSHRSKWGRRHPFMYMAAVPFGAILFLLFSPPSGLSETGLFFWLLTFAVLAHVLLTMYNIPHLALGADLSTDPTERTRIVAFRAMFQLVAGGATVPLSFYFIFKSTEAYQNGQLNPEAYTILGALGGIAVIAAILITSIGTHDQIPRLRHNEWETEPFSLRRILNEYRQVAKCRNYVIFFFSVIASLVGVAISSVLGVHMLTYFWQLTPTEIGHWGLAMLLGSFIGVPFWATVATHLEKKTMNWTGVVVYSLSLGILPIMMLAEAFPAHDSVLFLLLVLGSGFLARAGFAATMVSGGSMPADLADELELKTGKRIEGVLFSGLTFSSKISRALALQIAGIALDLIDFPLGVDPAMIDPQSVSELGMVYCASLLIPASISAMVISRYQLSRAKVLAVQKELAVRSEAV